MTEPSTICLDCGASILTATAAKTGGKCIPCARGTRAQMDQAFLLAAERRERDRKNRAALERIRSKQQPTFRDFTDEDSVAVLWSFLVATVFRGRTGLENLEALMPSARVIYLAGVLDGEVFNGGFHQYFSNSSGEHAHRTLFALHELGATRRASLLQRAIAIFPSKRVPQDRGERNDALDKTDFAVLEALDSEYYGLEKGGIEGLNEHILSFMARHGAECIAA